MRTLYCIEFYYTPVDSLRA